MVCSGCGPRRAVAFLLLSVGLSGRSAVAVSNPAYTVRELPVTSSGAAILDSINNNGQVCGTRYLPGSAPQAFLVTGNTVTDLTPPGTSNPRAYGLTPNGQVLISADGDVSVYDNGQFTSKGYWGTPYGGGYGINDSGLIVGGKSDGSTTVPAAFVNGAVTTLSTTFGQLVSVNNSGQMAGVCEAGDQQAWVRDAAGIFHMLGRMNRDYTQAVDINESGDVVFWAGTVSSIQFPQSFIYHMSDGTTTTISNSIAERYFHASSLNVNGVVLGDLYDGSNQPRGMGLYANGVLSNITAQLDPAGTSQCYRAADINDQGQILFEALSGTGWRYYVATPVPEPGGVVVLAVGCAAMMVRRRGRRSSGTR